MLICFSHLRWEFVFQRPQHLMGRFARTADVVYWEEPVDFGEPEFYLHTRKCEKTGVTLVTPHLAGGTSPAHVAGMYAGLIDALVVDEADADDLDGLGDVRPIVTRTLMSDESARKRLAEAALGVVVA